VPLNAVRERMESGLNQMFSYARQLSTEHKRLAVLLREARLRPGAGLDFEIADAVQWIEQLIVDADQQRIEIARCHELYVKLKAKAPARLDDGSARLRYSSASNGAPALTGDIDGDFRLAQASLQRSATLARSAIASAKKVF
jgi:hypothetical protein